MATVTVENLICNKDDSCLRRTLVLSVLRGSGRWQGWPEMFKGRYFSLKFLFAPGSLERFYEFCIQCLREESVLKIWRKGLSLKSPGLKGWGVARALGSYTHRKGSLDREEVQGAVLGSLRNKEPQEPRDIWEVLCAEERG